MARQSLRPQLNQIRAWVRQGRTDAWIAHQLGVPASQLRDFRSRHGLTAEGEEPASDVDLRDEIEAEIEAELGEPEPEEEEDATDEGDGESDGDGEARSAPAAGAAAGGAGAAAEGAAASSRRPSTRARRRATASGSTRRSRTTPPTPSTGRATRPLKVTIEPERIVLERVDD